MCATIASPDSYSALLGAYLNVSEKQMSIQGPILDTITRYQDRSLYTRLQGIIVNTLHEINVLCI
jgi:hypothetical protein